MWTYAVSTASMHDSQKLDDVLDAHNTASGGVGRQRLSQQSDRSEARQRDLKNYIHRRGSRNKPLTARQEAANKTRSKVRARVEHVFGNQHNSMGGKLVRTIGIVRATVKIGMQNLAYNMRRLVVLERIAVAAG